MMTGFLMGALIQAESRGIDHVSYQKAFKP